MEAIENFTSAEWKKVVEHIKKVIDEAWNKEGIIEQDVEQIIISITDADEDDEDSDEESENNDGACFVDDITQEFELLEEGFVLGGNNLATLSAPPSPLPDRPNTKAVLNRQYLT
ncbi:hypothetical protein J6590_080935 [Homalodisca vitripennis]|nr:hypothetical protein J6590_080935 [Homalodisca vitripennis]